MDPFSKLAHSLAVLSLALCLCVPTLPASSLRAEDAAAETADDALPEDMVEEEVQEAPLETKAIPAGPAFEGLPGRWVGKGLLGFKDGKRESVTCRATYFMADDRSSLKQNIRCASASGKVEVKSELQNAAGKLTGTWNELIYNLAGDLQGEVTPKGLRVFVKSDGLNASMDVIVKDTKQIIEINFNSQTLVGITLVLDKG